MVSKQNWTLMELSIYDLLEESLPDYYSKSAIW